MAAFSWFPRAHTSQCSTSLLVAIHLFTQYLKAPTVCQARCATFGTQWTKPNPSSHRAYSQVRAPDDAHIDNWIHVYAAQVELAVREEKQSRKRDWSVPHLLGNHTWRTAQQNVLNPRWCSQGPLLSEWPEAFTVGKRGNEGECWGWGCCHGHPCQTVLTSPQVCLSLLSHAHADHQENQALFLHCWHGVTGKMSFLLRGSQSRICVEMASSRIMVKPEAKDFVRHNHYGLFGKVVGCGFPGILQSSAVQGGLQGTGEKSVSGVLQEFVQTVGLLLLTFYSG